MLKSTCGVVLLAIAGVTVLAGEESKTDPRIALLEELGSKLDKTPKTEQECQALLREIKDWQVSTLKRIRKEGERALRITRPKNGANVPERVSVEGVVSEPSAQVWVIVHPMEVGDYWVQPKLKVREDGTWKVLIHIGRPGDVDKGKQFEIMAVANPEVELKGGKVLKFWPEATWESQVIEVTRQ